MRETISLSLTAVPATSFDVTDKSSRFARTPFVSAIQFLISNNNSMFTICNVLINTTISHQMYNFGVYSFVLKLCAALKRVNISIELASYVVLPIVCYLYPSPICYLTHSTDNVINVRCLLYTCIYIHKRTNALTFYDGRWCVYCRLVVTVSCLSRSSSASLQMKAKKC